MSTPSAYQKVVTQYDVTEAGVASIFYSVWDNTDDILPITLPAITGGTVALVGLNGIWIEDDWDYAGGTLNIGPTTIAGLPAGILDVVGGLCAVIINDRAWTAAERAGVVAWGKARGAPGEIRISDTEEITNGDFSGGATGWSTFGGWGIADGVATHTEGAAGEVTKSLGALVDGQAYLAVFDVVSSSGVGGDFRFRVGNTAGWFFGVSKDAGTRRFAVNRASYLQNVVSFYAASNVGAVIDNASLRKLELLP